MAGKYGFAGIGILEIFRFCGGSICMCMCIVQWSMNVQKNTDNQLQWMLFHFRFDLVHRFLVGFKELSSWNKILGRYCYRNYSKALNWRWSISTILSNIVYLKMRLSQFSIHRTSPLHIHHSTRKPSTCKFIIMYSVQRSKFPAIFPWRQIAGTERTNNLRFVLCGYAKNDNCVTLFWETIKWWLLALYAETQKLVDL